MSPLSPAEIDRAFAGPIPPIPVTAGYRLRLLSVLAGLVLLQLLYLALITLVAGLGYLCLRYATGVISLRLWIGLFLYLAPPAAALVLLTFLLKPLIARPAPPPKALELDPEREPVLFAFVQRLCRTVGAPMPQVIRVNLQANAFAALRGWRGMLAGTVELTIGLPLVRGLSLAGFTGVLAHEFGHFAQRAGLRSHFLIQSIQHWFARVVYERDSWDDWLEGLIQESEDTRITIVRQIARAGVWLGRWYLSKLMIAGQWVSAAFSRQMEFDADRYEAAVVGTAVFRETSLRLPELATAAELAWNTTQQNFNMGRLPDDVASLAEAHAAMLPPQQRRELHDAELKRTTERLSTHPATAERIASVERWGPPGCFTLAGPATRLFQDLEEVSRQATRHHYELVLGDQFRAEKLFASATLVESLQRDSIELQGMSELVGLDAIYWLNLPDEFPAAAPTPAGPWVAIDYGRDKYGELLQAFGTAMVQRKLAREGLVIEGYDEALVEAKEREMEAENERLRSLAAPLLDHLAAAAQSLGEARDAWRALARLLRTRTHFWESQFLLHTMAAFGHHAPGDAAYVARRVDEYAAEGRAITGRALDSLSGIPSVIILDPRAAATLHDQLDPGDNLEPREALDVFATRWASVARSTLGRLCALARPRAETPEQLGPPSFSAG